VSGLPPGPGSRVARDPLAALQHLQRVGAAWQIPCTFRNSSHLLGARHDVELYLGDKELYRSSPGSRELAPRSDGALRAVAFREATSKFPVHAWGKYDLHITYEVSNAAQGASASAGVTYGYLESLDLLLSEALAGRSPRCTSLAGGHLFEPHVCCWQPLRLLTARWPATQPRA